MFDEFLYYVAMTVEPGKLIQVLLGTQSMTSKKKVTAVLLRRYRWEIFSQTFMSKIKFGPKNIDTIMYSMYNRPKTLIQSCILCIHRPKTLYIQSCILMIKLKHNDLTG
ncbi:hypothetical protein Avbf_16221 [Armadillidium vulgare]|nr:hypothetical protein Avbf_16221 [Armadillidium vulgare]